ncbi:EthD family reductase [Flagellimonas sp. 389]|uniref:EthD family reductase n=1 Tax=Flagellimonas sp. 389 TaxID=2835862 RepID=UPI001BD632D5|nr:EthD family reductase [Flagellimonas sp. 389]MBS9463435.1 EthD family reductase [Flagellimonas sp. 389]
MKTKIILLTLGLIVLLSSCEQAPSKAAIIAKKGMVKVIILYPNSEGKTFNMDYYANKHMPMIAHVMGDALQCYTIDKGISGRTADDPIPYLAIGYLYFNKLSDYRNAFPPNAKKIVGDVPNYTNIQPIVQISEVME